MPINVRTERSPNNAVMSAQQLVRQQIDRLDRAVNMTTQEFEAGRPLLGMRPKSGNAWNWSDAEQAARLANALEALLNQHGL